MTSSERTKVRKYNRNLERLSSRSSDREKELLSIEKDAIARFKGQVTTLESALGMLRIGDHVGWKPLAIIHSRRTLRKYEAILGISVKEFFPEVGPSAERNTGYLAATKVKDFWKAVTGEEKIEKKQEFEN